MRSTVVFSRGQSRIDATSAELDRSKISPYQESMFDREHGRLQRKVEPN